MLIKSLKGLNVSLKDNNVIQEFRFGDNSVAATIGTKDGAVCAPLLTLTINGDSSITMHGQSIELKWENIEINEKYISALCNGKPSIYDIKPKV